MRLADEVGLAVDDREDLFYLTLLRMAGCTVESSSMAYHFGDEVRFGADTPALDDRNYQEFGTWVTEHFANDQSERVREQFAGWTFPVHACETGKKLVGHGEVARLVAVEMGLGAALIESLNFASSVGMVREPPARRAVSAFR